VPAGDHTPEDNQRALDALLARFSSRPVDAQLLDRVKNQARANIARVLGNNHQLAALLPAYIANFGNWRDLFTSLADFEHVTAEDVQRVALQYFAAGNRTAAYLTTGEQRGRQ
jgi:predicted Zn-dependent peptidase